MFPTLLCLHGWGGSKESFTELRAALSNTQVRILTPDLPGFGDEKDPPTAWTVDDYADWVENYIMKQGFEGPILLLGHSHGGRISIKLATRGTLPIRHLYLCASAGIRRARHWKRIVGLIISKTGKTFMRVPGLSTLQPIARKLLYKLIRVHDYEKANAVMRDTMIKVTEEDLRPLLSKIHTSTDLFWGENDGMTPIADGHIMHAEIKGSHLHTYPGVRHGVHRDKAAEIAKIIERDLAAV